jgi:hypothetical protein
VFIAVLELPAGVKALKIEYSDTPAMIIVQNISLKAIAPPVYIKPMTYGDLISCLEYHESKGNPTARGKDGEIGCLQFLPKTFEEFCVKKYKFRNDPYDPEIQRQCADQMISENWKNVYLWTTAKKCLK